MKRVVAVLSCALIALTPWTLAADTTTSYNRVTLNASASQSVGNDLLVVVMFAQAEGRDAAGPANEVNQKMDWALTKAANTDRVVAQTLAYQTNAVYKDSRIRGWRVRQSLRLESANAEVLGDLAGALQERLGIQSIEYQLSETHRRERVTELTDAALQRFTQRAGRVAESLGRESFRLVRLSINDDTHRPPPVMRAMMAEATADRAAPPARFEAGTQRLKVTISGEIELSED